MNPTQAFLAETLFLRELDVARLRALAPVVRWNEVVDIAGEAGVLPFVHRALMAAGLGGYLGKAESRRTMAASMWARAKMESLIRDAARIQAALRDAHVESVVLKGVALAALDPDYGALRPTSDLDVLVRPVDLGVCEQVISGLGSARLGVREVRTHDGRTLVAGMDHEIGSPHAAPYLTPSGQIVEPHFEIPGRPWLERGETDAFWARTRLVQVAGGRLRVPALEDLLGIACHHVLVQHFGDPRLVPRHIADVHVLMSLGADAELCMRWYDGPRRAPVRESLQLARHGARRGGQLWWSDPAQRAFSAGWVRVQRRLVRVRSGMATLRVYGARALFPTSTFLAARHGVRSDSWTIPLLRLWWPFSVLIRALKGR